MRIEKDNFEGTIIQQEPLTYIMEKHGFVLGSQWDYERMTFDYKMNSQIEGVTYYLRVAGEAIEGDVDFKTAVLRLKEPYLGTHYYPHGVEYGEDEEYPQPVLDKVDRVLDKVSEELGNYKEETNQ